MIAPSRGIVRHFAAEPARAAHSEALRKAAQKHCRLGLGPDDHEALTGFWCHVPPGILGQNLVQLQSTIAVELGCLRYLERIPVAIADNLNELPAVMLEGRV